MLDFCVVFLQKLRGLPYKGAMFIFDERFFVRQVKNLEGYIIICREGFGLYNGKRSETYILTRDFFVRRFKDSAADMNIGKEALGCITEKDPKLTF